jgi:hypothetical protein
MDDPLAAGTTAASPTPLLAIFFFLCVGAHDEGTMREPEEAEEEAGEGELAAAVPRHDVDFFVMATMTELELSFDRSSSVVLLLHHAPPSLVRNREALGTGLVLLMGRGTDTDQVRLATNGSGSDGRV